MYFVKTVESPCRSCENENMNKEECGRECLRLIAFQRAILHVEEANIYNYQLELSKRIAG